MKKKTKHVNKQAKRITKHTNQKSKSTNKANTFEEKNTKGNDIPFNRDPKYAQWIKWLIFPIYQVGITAFFLGYYLYSFIGKFFNIPIPSKTLSHPPLPKAKEGGNSNQATKHSNKPFLVWIHAVSGGEVKLADKIIKEFYPEKTFGKNGKVLLSYCSKTGKEMTDKLSGEHSHLITTYLPIDFYPLTRRWLKYIKKYYRIKKYIVIEHDLWPNWLGAMKENGVKRVVANYFLKPRDYAWYFFFPIAYHFVHDVDTLLTQNEQVTEQVNGFTPHFEVITAGNLKYTLPDPSEKSHTNKSVTPSNKKATQRNSITITLGSSHNGEEELFLLALTECFKKYNKDYSFQVIIIPRHPERAKTKKLNTLISQFVKSSPKKLGMEWTTFNPRKKTTGKNTSQVILVDEMGWNEHFYRESDIVIVGDTFFPSQGGHNFLEPLGYGKSVLYGPHMINYADITPQLEKIGAVIRISIEETGHNLSTTLTDLIANPSRRIEMGKKGIAFIKDNQYDKTIYRKTLD